MISRTNKARRDKAARFVSGTGENRIRGRWRPICSGPISSAANFFGEVAFQHKRFGVRQRAAPRRAGGGGDGQFFRNGLEI